ncbi:amidohydrolase [Sphingomonas sp. BLCC-B65]|nr:amidohydrolase [Sphingomonas sp. BLCC-B65]
MTPLPAPPLQDVAVIGGHILNGGPDASAVAVRNGKIVLVGTDADARDAAGHRAVVIDAGGGTIMPGFDDAHAHVLSGAALSGRLRLSPGQSRGEVYQAIASWSGDDDGWVIGSGWHYGSFDGGTPTRADLDAVTGERPAYLSSFDGHTTWVNSAALRRAGIDAQTPDPRGGSIDRDPDGAPTGILREDATDLFRPFLPLPSHHELATRAAATMHELATLGITAVQDPGCTIEELAVWRDLRDAGDLTTRVRLALPLPPDIDDDVFLTLLDDYRRALQETVDDTWLAGGALKGFVDGVLETRSAAVLSPYGLADAGPASLGEAFFTAERLTALVTAADHRGWQVQLHAIGDRAVRMGLDAVAAARSIRSSGIPHRIEHIEICDPSDIPRFGALDVVASMQPLHASCDPRRVAEWDRLLGPERSINAWPSAQIQAAGGTVALGSDWPVASHDPLEILRAAVTPSNDTLAGPAAHPNSLDLQQALAAYTRGSARAARAEERRGALAEHHDGDIVVIDRDLTEHLTSADAAAVLGAARVTATIVAGRVTHRC